MTDSGIKSAQCGGALVTEDAIVTAAHCVNENGIIKQQSRIVVRLGEHNIERDAPEDAVQDFEVQQVISHPKFEPKTYHNDIAILKLKRKVRLQCEYKRKFSILSLPWC